MIEEIVVKNFKTLRDVTIPLSPGITVMVGANNSGKSNALAVLRLVRESARQDDFSLATDALGGIHSIRTRGVIGEPIEVTLRGRFDEAVVSYSLVIPFHGSAEASWSEHRGSDEALELWGALRNARVHDLSVAPLRAPSLVQRGAQLEPDGQNIAAVLDNLAGDDPSRRDAVDEMVRASAHEVKRIVTRPGEEPGTKVLGVEEQNGSVYGAADMSDGLLLFIGLAVAMQMLDGRPGILAIEEPERGIHPRRLRELINQLLRLTASGIQVILTTHSPTLLDEFRDTPENRLRRGGWTQALQLAPINPNALAKASPSFEAFLTQLR